MTLLNDTLAAIAPERSLIIGGDARAGAATFDVADPATGNAIAQCANGTVDDAIAAADAAAAAFDDWRRTPPRQRGEILRRTWELLVADIDALAALIVAENGKSEADARAEVNYAAEFFRWFGEEAVRNVGNFGESPAGGTRTIVTHKPVGVAALVTPWNFPAAMATRKIAPALAAGCTTMLKPASETPLTAIAIMHHLKEAGVPDGVVNLLTSKKSGDVVQTWLEHAEVRKISFTGSTGVGRILLRQAADRIVNSSMELGGNAPFVVTDGASIEDAVDGAMLAKFRNGGQACTAANRFFVHSSVVDSFVSSFGDQIASLNVGPGTDPDNQVGPLISARAVAGVQKLVDAALAEGAEITHRAQTPDGPGHWFAPMLVSGVRPDSPLVTEEIFGPVAPIVTWDSEDELIEMMNASEYGLSGYVYAGDLQRAVRISEEMDAGMIGINRGLVSDPAAPFGGVKQSGLGREGAREGLEEFQETQYFSVAWN